MPQDIEGPLRQLASVLRPSLSRTIRVGEMSGGGDYHITDSNITISRDYATSGNPVEAMKKVLAAVDEFDRREEEERRRHIEEAKEKVSIHLGYLLRSAPEEVSPLLSQTLQEERSRLDA